MASLVHAADVLVMISLSLIGSVTHDVTVTTPPTLAILTEASLSECVVAVDTENGKRRANDAKCTMLG